MTIRSLQDRRGDTGAHVCSRLDREGERLCGQKSAWNKPAWETSRFPLIRYAAGSGPDSPAGPPRGRRRGQPVPGACGDCGAASSARVSARPRNLMFQAAEAFLVYLSSGDLDLIPSCPPRTHRPMSVTSCSSGGREVSSGKALELGRLLSSLP